MKNILVLTDFSNPAYEALFYISGLLRHQEAAFYILNSYTEHTPLQTPSVGLVGKSLTIQLKDESLEELNQTAHRIRLDRPNSKHTIEIISVFEHLPEATLKVSGNHKIDLIVMGNKGQSNRLGVYFGSNVLRILNTVKIPILAVPESVEDKKPNEIAFAADFNHAYTGRQIAPLKELATCCSAAIRLLHLNEEERLSESQMKNLEMIKELLSGLPHTLHWMPDFRQKADAIHSFLTERGIGMLAMVKHEYGFLERLMREDVIKKVSFMVEVPFLILPDME